jgi:hypothetical protein
MGTTKILRFASSTMAVAATSVALGISYVAGTERGGLPMERAIWIGVGLVLALSAHLIPALLGRQSVARKAVGYALWLACMVTTIGGHAQFFLQAQAHAGQVRAQAIARPVAQGRDMIAILDDKAQTEQKLAAKQALLKSRYCKAGCTMIPSEIAGLQGRLIVLNAEQARAEKDAKNQDRYEAKTEQASMDPVAVALSQFGVSPDKVQTLMSMAAALTLELIACLFWSISLSPLPIVARQEKRETAPVAAPAPVTVPEASPAPVMAAQAPAPAAHIEPDPVHAVQIPMESAATDEASPIDEALANVAVAVQVAKPAEEINAMPFEDRVKAMIRIARAEIAAGLLKRSERAILARFGGTRKAARKVSGALLDEAKGNVATAT